jgi:hypothetical protein
MWNKYHALFFERTYVEDLKYYSKAVLARFSEVEKILDIPFVWVLYFYPVQIIEEDIIISIWLI